MTIESVAPTHTSSEAVRHSDTSAPQRKRLRLSVLLKEFVATNLHDPSPTQTCVGLPTVRRSPGSLETRHDPNAPLGAAPPEFASRGQGL